MDNQTDRLEQQEPTDSQGETPSPNGSQREALQPPSRERRRPGSRGPSAAQAAGAGEEATAPASPMPPINPLTAGQIVHGLIVHIDEHGALVDVGTKSEGHIPTDELGQAHRPAGASLGSGAAAEAGKPLEVGDRIAVYVVRTEDEDGSPILSKKRADYELIWDRITEAHQRGEVLSAMVTDRVKGGLVVDLGLRGFLPASHVRTRNVHALDRFVGQSLKVKILEVDRARKRVVVSQKEAIEEARRLRRDKTLASLEENKVYRGIVRRITDYGAFVDVGGIDGLLHVTEMSWTRINHPRDVVKVGDKIDVMILRYDREQNRISLGLKQILPDPWGDIESLFGVGQIVTGTITRVVPFGAFVRLEGGIEGILPNAELPGGRGQRAQDVVAVGESVQVKITSIRPQERRMSLSLRQVEQARERRELKEYLAREEESSRVTIGDLFGSVLSGTQAARQGNSPRESGDVNAAEAPTMAPEEAAEQQEDLSATGDLPQAAEGQGSQDSSEDEGGSAAAQWSSSESPAESEAEKD